MQSIHCMEESYTALKDKMKNERFIHSVKSWILELEAGYTERFET